MNSANPEQSGDAMTNVKELEKLLRENIAKNKSLCAAIGVAIFNPKTDNNFEDAFKRADAAMYENKKELKKATCK